MRIIDVRGRGLTEQELTTIRAIGTDEYYVTYRTKPKRYLEIDYEVRAKSKEALRKKLDEISGFIETKDKVPIVFPDEPDRTYYGEYAGTDDYSEDNRRLHHLGRHRGTIFILRDPYKYGEEKELNFTDDSIIIENNGTATAKPIIELTAKEKSTFAMVTLGDEQFNIIGQPADDDVQIVDSRTSVLYENGSTISDWQTATNQMIDDGIFEISGTMGADAAGIRPSGYGTGSALHGPAVFKEINPIQDFEIEPTFDINSTREIDSWRMGINFLDENLNMLGHCGVKDNNRSFKQRTPLARYGPYRGGGVSNGNLIGDDDTLRNVRDLTLFYIRTRRIGNTFSFYIAYYRGTRHVETWSASFRDVDNNYAGKLKYITLYIANFADRPLPSRLRINSVEVFELATVEEDQTPYNIYPGDVVTFDHVNADVLLNGELSKDTFFGDFFELNKGVNTLTVSPSNTFDAQVKFRERWR